MLTHLIQSLGIYEDEYGLVLPDTSMRSIAAHLPPTVGSKYRAASRSLSRLALDRFQALFDNVDEYFLQFRF